MKMRNLIIVAAALSLAACNDDSAAQNNLAPFNVEPSQPAPEQPSQPAPSQPDPASGQSAPPVTRDDLLPAPDNGGGGPEPLQLPGA